MSKNTNNNNNNMTEKHPLLGSIPSGVALYQYDENLDDETRRKMEQQAELEKSLLQRIPNLVSGTATYSHPSRSTASLTPPMPSRSPPGHHRRFTSLSDFLKMENRNHRPNLRSLANEIVHQTAADFSETFQKDIQATRTGKRYFLDMTLTRSLSVVPENLEDFLMEAIQDFDFSRSLENERHPFHDDELAALWREASDDSISEERKKMIQEKLLATQQLEAQQQHPLLVDQSATKQDDEIIKAKKNDAGSIVTAYLGLFVAVVAVSSNGTALSLLHGVDPCLKLYWRMTATALLLSVFAIRSSIRSYNRNKYDTDGTTIKSFGAVLLENMQLDTIFEFVCAVIAFTIHTILYFYAFKYTSIGNAVIFANSQALLLIIGKACVGEQVLFLEAAGVVIAFSGAILCCADSDRPDEETGGNNKTEPVRDDKMFENTFGDALALGAAITGVIYLTLAKAVRSKIKTTVFMFLVMFFGSFLVLLYMTVMGIKHEWNDDPIHGLFGWLSFNDGTNNFIILLYIALICNVCGTMGFVRAMKFFDNLIIAVATLLEPMIATFIAYGFDVGPLPGWLGWTGNVLVAVGTFGVVYPSINNKNAPGH